MILKKNYIKIKIVKNKSYFYNIFGNKEDMVIKFKKKIVLQNIKESFFKIILKNYFFTGVFKNNFKTKPKSLFDNSIRK